ncbi:hypothetical protein HKX48_005369 [Thoreauomyces humboldtii]|nr:hypothetical protein HKX48_005369 [Thoreauomyces humboldtii]
MNIGLAIRTLRDDLPHFPSSGLSTYDIYSHNVTFSEPYRTHFVCHGLRWYKLLASTVHSALNLAFVDTEVAIVGIQQRRMGRGGDDGNASGGGEGSTIEQGHEDRDGEDRGGGGSAEDMQLVVRWIFEGTPRIMAATGAHPVRSVYEGVFVYTFDSDGLISEHRLAQIHPEPPEVVSWLARVFGVPPRDPAITVGINRFMKTSERASR